MTEQERTLALIERGYTSYAHYLRGVTEGLEVGETVKLDTFGHATKKARNSLKQVALAQSRSYRSFKTADNELTIMRIR